MYKHLSPTAYRSAPTGLAKIPRNSPIKDKIPILLKEEARMAVLYDSNNSMNFYQIPTPKKLPTEPSKHSEASYKSIHNIADPKDKQQVMEKFLGRKYTKREKEALNEIRKKQGNLYLLSDL